MATLFVNLFLMALVAYDLCSLRKLHRATIWRASFVAIGQAIRVPIGLTHPWFAFAGMDAALGR